MVVVVAAAGEMIDLMICEGKKCQHEFFYRGHVSAESVAASSSSWQRGERLAKA